MIARIREWSRASSKKLAIGFAVTSAALTLGSYWIILSFPLEGTERFVSETWVWSIPGIAYIVVGAFITLNSARNPVGWMFSWLGLFGSISFMLLGLGAGPLSEATAGPWLTTIGDAINTLGIVVFVALAIHFFPDGELVTPRWRWAVWVTVAAGTVGATSALLVGGWGGDAAQAAFPSPLRDEVGDVGVALQAVFWPLMLTAWGSGVVGLVVRFVRSRGLQRRQMKWLIVPVFFFVVIVLFDFVLPTMSVAGVELSTVVTSLGISSVPVAVAIGVVRHGLYDIDLVISRSLVVAGLGGFITLVYVAVVVGLGNLVGSGDEPNLVLQVAATALVAVMFQPARRRLRSVADRLVYGHRASPYEVLSTFSREAARHSESTLDAIAALLSEGTGADPAIVWLRVGDRVVPAASTGDLNGIRSIAADDGFVDSIPGENVVPVLQDAEILGALAIHKPRGEQVTSQDADLMERLAAGAGVVLRNNRLTAELQARLEELRDSRRRLVSAQDETRRKLERDLHDGAQQQLVALKVKLGLAKSLAAKAGASQTATLLDQLATEADEAVDTLRDLARGIYPPLLEAEGLPTAIEAQARKAALPITVHAAGVGRYGREVESAVYFCLLEAISNAAKYSEATSVHVRLAEQSGLLEFVVEDDGRGFEEGAVAEGTGLQGMEDRLDTINGSFVIQSKPGKGTVIRGKVPVGAGVAA